MQILLQGGGRCEAITDGRHASTFPVLPGQGGYEELPRVGPGSQHPLNAPL